MKKLFGFEIQTKKDAKIKAKTDFKSKQTMFSSFLPHIVFTEISQGQKLLII